MLLIVPGVNITFDSAWAQALTFSFSMLSVLSAKMVPDIVGHRVLRDTFGGSHGVQDRAHLHPCN